VFDDHWVVWDALQGTTESMAMGSCIKTAYTLAGRKPCIWRAADAPRVDCSVLKERLEASVIYVCA
jgi:hypothetical protein